MSPDQYAFWVEFLKNLPKGVEASANIHLILMHEEYSKLTTDGKIVLLTMIMGQIRFGSGSK